MTYGCSVPLRHTELPQLPAPDDTSGGRVVVRVVSGLSATGGHACDRRKSMNHGEELSWTAVVVTIPVLLLALVVEARLVRPDLERRRALGTQWRDTVGGGGITFARVLLKVFYVVVLRGYLAILATVVLIGCDIIGLYCLYARIPLDDGWVIAAILGIGYTMCVVVLLLIADRLRRDVMSLRARHHDEQDPATS